MGAFDDGTMRAGTAGPALASGDQRQRYAEVYFVSGAIYLTRTDAYLRHGSRTEPPTVPYVMGPLDSIDIDTPDDAVIADLLLRRRAGAG